MADIIQDIVGGQLRITVIGNNSSTADDANLAAATTALNANGGRSILRLVGQFTITGYHTFTAPVSVIGDNGIATINCQSASNNHAFYWTGGASPESGTVYDIDSSGAFAEYFISSAYAATTPVAGDWIVVYSHAQIAGVAPHLGDAAGQHPMEMHQINEFDSGNNKIYVNGFIVDEMATEAGAKVYPFTPLDGIAVRNLEFKYTGTTLADYSKVLNFSGCVNVRIEDTVTIARNGPGAIRFDFCANATCNASIAGQDKLDNVYGVLVTCVNGLQINGTFDGCRHFFTTAAGMTYSTSHTLTSVDTSTDTITKSGHGLVDGQHVHFTTSGTLPTGLSVGTHYWARDVAASTYKVSATPGGSAVNLSGTGSGTHTANEQARFGTPINVIVKGIARLGGKVNPPSDSSPGTRTGFDTHAEGYGIVCSMKISVGGVSTASVCAQSRSRGTIFKDCVFEGNAAGAYGVSIEAAGCKVENSTFLNGWVGVRVRQPSGSPNSALSINNTVIANNVFSSMGRPIIVEDDVDDVQITGNTFPKSGDMSSTASVWYTKNFVSVENGATNLLIANNNFNKDTNDYSVDIEGPTSNVTFVGNTTTGYGSSKVGAGRTATVSSVDTGADTITFASNVGWQTNDPVQISSTGTLPTGLSTSTTYYVIRSSETILQLASVADGSAINITGTGSGTITLASDSNTSLDSTYASKNFTD